jgi:hypothetical protein
MALEIEDGQPGFVSDGYLSAIAAETTTTALEPIFVPLNTGCAVRLEGWP